VSGSTATVRPSPLVSAEIPSRVGGIGVADTGEPPSQFAVAGVPEETGAPIVRAGRFGVPVTEVVARDVAAPVVDVRAALPAETVGAACAVTIGDAGAASAASASRRMLSEVGAGVAPAVSASELFPAINRIGCPVSSFVTLVTSSASCRSLVTRADALSALLGGGPILAGVSAAVNVRVNFAFAASVETPSADATEAASKLASRDATSLGEVPPSRSAWICSSSAASGVVAATVVVVAVEAVPVLAVLADASASREPSSWVLNVGSLPIAFADAAVCVPPV